MHVVIQGAGRGIGYAMAKQAMAAGATQLILNSQASSLYHWLSGVASVRHCALG